MFIDTLIQILLGIIQAPASVISELVDSFAEWVFALFA